MIFMDISPVLVIINYQYGIQVGHKDTEEKTKATPIAKSPHNIVF